MIRVIRELIYVYPDAETYLADRKNWTKTYLRRPPAIRGPLSMHSLVIDERAIDGELSACLVCGGKGLVAQSPGQPSDGHCACPDCGEVDQ